MEGDDELIGSTEIAVRLGKHPATVRNWATRRDTTGFPEPEIRGPRDHLWLWGPVREWAVRTGRLSDD